MAYSEKLRKIHHAMMDAARDAGLFKEERAIHAAQGVEIDVEYPLGNGVNRVLNFCSNNYLGLSSHPEVVQAAKDGLDARGYGMSSVRFICGTQDIHKELERRLSDFLGMQDTLLYSSCFDANLGVFEALLGEEDAIITDKLNHASIIDGVRMCKAKRHIYEHSDMQSLEEQLIAAQGARARMVVTDGVFSMDGDIAKLPEICGLSEKYDAMLMVDDSHATGFMGKTGRGTAEYHGVQGRVDIMTTTFGKALGGASGGCASGRQELIDILRQYSRPYTFSNALAPSIVAATLRVMGLIAHDTTRRDKLIENKRYWREKLTVAGFDIKPGTTPIVPVMLYNARLAQEMARELFFEGVFVTGFFYPVVQKGNARIRTQLSAAHTREQLDFALEAFIKVEKKHGILGLKGEDIIAKYGH